MELKAFVKKHENSIAAFLMVLALFLPIVFRFDFYYDLNDDVLIKDILSGVYTGRPDGHAVQLLYPLGGLLALLYRALSVPVFGIFLVLCQFGSIFVIGYRTAGLCRNRKEKGVALAAEGIFFMAAFGSHLVFLQYTVTAGMLACAAIFWVLTGKDAPEGGGGQKRTALSVAFLRKNLPALALYWTAFNLRTEMALLLLPLAGVAGLCRWSREKKGFTKENAACYLSVFGALMLGMGLFWGADSLAYAGEDWSDFRQFFEERTELYDYQRDFVEDYETNSTAYGELGVSKVRQTLLANYNFGVDDGIDTAFLAALKEKAVDRPKGGISKNSLSVAVWKLVHENWLGAGDFPFNFVWIAAMACVFSLCVRKGFRAYAWQAPLSLCTGGVLFLYLLLRDRPMPRVTHPLYLGMTVLFAGLLLQYRSREEETEETVFPFPRPAGLAAGSLAVLVLCICLIPVLKTWADMGEETAAREETNRINEAVMEYCSAHPGTLFLEDVYSTVDFSEKITVDRRKPVNYDLLGGWLVKSPLTAQKLFRYGYRSMGEAVRAGGNVCLLTAAESDMGWLTDYFAEEKVDARVVKTGSIAESVDLYQVLPETGEGKGEMFYGKD